MKTQLSILLTAIVGGVVSAMPAQAASFGTNGISFDQDTTVDFEFTQSYGRYRTDLRVYEVVDGEIFQDLGLLFGEVKAADEVGDNGEPTSEPLGTAGNTVVDYEASFNFEADKEYTLGIVNYGHWEAENDPTPYGGIFYSTSALNNDGTQQAVFGSKGGEELSEFDASLYQNGDPFAGLLDISFDDAGNNNDKDFQDFTISAKVNEEFGGGVLSESVPEPATLAGLAMVAGGMFLSRSSKKQN